MKCDVKYIIDPNNNIMCMLIPCQPRQWRDSKDACKPNPTNCLLANDVFGTCRQADPGFYITAAQQILPCSGIDSRCLACSGPIGFCTQCQSSYQWDGTLKICKRICLGSRAILPDNSACYQCDTIDPQCNQCKDFDKLCLACLPGWKMPSSRADSYLPRICIPECQTGEYVDFTSVGSTNLVCKPCTANCAVCSDFTGVCTQCSSQISYYLDPIDKKCYVKCSTAQYRTSNNTCDTCPQFCQACRNFTGGCTTCLPNYKVNSQSKCQKMCDPGKGFSPPDSCLPCKDSNCKSCEDISLFCTECKDQFYLGNEIDPQTGKACKMKCREGPFSDPTIPNYDTERRLSFQALSENNTCVDCRNSCYRCRNITLECVD